MTGIFATWQPRYAEHGIATIPVNAYRKKPEVKRPHLLGIRGSTELARRFPKANAIGLIAGRRTGIAVLDIDTTDERVLADALARHGQTPLIVRTASRKFHGYYRHNAEGRCIRPFLGLPIDIIGGGLLVAPPSESRRGNYEIIQGTLDDLGHLPAMRDAPCKIARQQTLHGARNTMLWEHCMRQARSCDSFDALLDVARTQNDAANVPPLADAEVVKTARSAWRYEQEGDNRFGEHGIWFPTDEANTLIKTDPDAFLLLAFLRANNGRKSTFFVSNGMAPILGWSRKRLAKARRRLEQSDMDQVRPASKCSGAALYRWKPKGGRN